MTPLSANLSILVFKHMLSAKLVNVFSTFYFMELISLASERLNYTFISEV